MPAEWIDTQPDLVRAIRKAKRVWVLAHFGCSERYFRVSKAEALRLACSMTPDTTPREMEMASDFFAHVLEDSPGDLYLG